MHFKYLTESLFISASCPAAGSFLAVRFTLWLCFEHCVSPLLVVGLSVSQILGLYQLTCL